MPHRVQAIVTLVALAGCGSTHTPETPRRPAAHTEKEIAAFRSALEQCQSDEDCAPLASAYRYGEGTDRDEEASAAASLKGCLAGATSLCSAAGRSTNGTAPPGAADVISAYCKGRDEFVCAEIEQIRRNESKTRLSIQHACRLLLSTPATVAPADIGPLVDLCPGLSTPAQRERARLFRTAEAIDQAYADARVGTPRQVRRFVERLEPLGDPRAAEIFERGKRRFGQAPSEAFIRSRQQVAESSGLTLCAFDGETAYLANESHAGALWFAFKVVTSLTIPYAVIFWLPDAPPSDQEQQKIDEAARAEALRIRGQILQATGAKNLVEIPWCSDVAWFQKMAGHVVDDTVK